MNSNEEINLRILNFTEEEKENYASISKLRVLLSDLKGQFDPDNPDCPVSITKDSYETFRLISQAFNLSQKIFYTMQEGLHDSNSKEL